MTAFLTFAVVGLGTYLSRAIFIVGVGERTLPPEAERFIRAIGPSVLAALVAQLLMGEGIVAFATSLPEVGGVLAAVAAALVRRSALAGFVGGVATFLVLDLLL